VWVPFQIFFPRPAAGESGIPGGFPFPGGWLLGGLLLINLLAAHTLRFRFIWKDIFLVPLFGGSFWLMSLWEDQTAEWGFLTGGILVFLAFAAVLFLLHGKRGGVIIIHLGIVVMMLSELTTGIYAIESQMFIAESEKSNYVDVSRETELALVTPADAHTDDTAVIPEHVLRRGGLISDPALPVDVLVHEYLPNSNLVSGPDTEENRKKGWPLGLDGRRWGVQARSEEAGVGAGGRDDLAAARVTLKRKDNGKEIGHYLVSLYFNSNVVRRKLQFVPHEFELDGKTYTVELRPKRIYKGFSVHLIDFQHKRYLGTSRPKDFTSVVRLTDPERNEDRKIRISMNDPLRYGGETFYQQAFAEDDSGTVLQVVRNPGWLMPYISCVMVTLGMLAHFGFILGNFLRKRLVAS